MNIILKKKLFAAYVDRTHDLQIRLDQLQSLYNTVRNGTFHLHELK